MKNVLVTGANKGIGLAVVTEVLRTQPDALVILGSRDLARGTEARARLLRDNPTWDNRLITLQLDVSCDTSVAHASAALSDLLPSAELHGIVNNAGMGSGTVAEVIDVNLHGIRRVCAQIAPLLSPGGRIINVTSASAPNFVANCTEQRRAFFCNPDIEWEELQSFIELCGELEPSRLQELGLGSDSAYGFSKACANSYTLLLARQYPDLYVNACTPGFIETDLGKEFLGSRTPEEAGMRSPTDGAQVVLELLFGETRGSGHYYGSDALRSPMDRYRAPGSAEFTGGD